MVGSLVAYKNRTSEPADVVAGDTADNTMVMDAFSGSGSIKCDYDQGAGLVGTVYVKDGKVRIDGTIEGGVLSVLYGSGQVYTWGMSEGYEYGFVYDTETADAEIAAGMENVPSRTEIENQFNNGAARCEDYDAPNSFFTPPPSVTFQNISELNSMMPAGVGPAGY